MSIEMYLGILIFAILVCLIGALMLKLIEWLEKKRIKYIVNFIMANLEEIILKVKEREKNDT